MAFNDILKRKDAAMMTQIGHLQAKIVAEDKLMEQRAQDMLVDWETGKPIQVRLPTGCVCVSAAWVNDESFRVCLFVL